MSRAPAPTASAGGRDSVGASSELVPGKPGSPTQTEREAIYESEVRQGGPGKGWVVARAREWGLSHSTVSEELAAVRQAVDEERGLEGCQIAAHNLTMQAVDLADEIEHLARSPVERETARDMTGEELAALIEARGKAKEGQAKVLNLSATLKLRAAASLLAIHRRPVVLESGGSGQPPTPDPNKLKAR